MNAAECHILVVDDHALQRAFLVRMLGSLQVSTVFEAASGADALALIRTAETPFDLVISDLDMPDMDGMELARGIAALPLPPPVALVSALEEQILASVGSLSRAGGAALLSILPKPVSIDALREAITRLGSSRPAAAVAEYSDEEIAAGFAAGQFVPWYEPQVDLFSGDVEGFEALVRWHHPRDGLLSPARFLDQVERSPELLEALTRAVLVQALDRMQLWQAAGYAGGLSVNLSPLSLHSLECAGRVNNAVLERGLDPKRITFELTESATANGSAAIENITRLRIKGFRLSIDDFGTGYSSLQQLSQLPLSELKIDRCFTSRMLEDKVSRAAVESSLQLAQRLSLRTCGEGIESSEVVRQLRWLGCELGQGYLFTRPLPPERVLPWLADWTARRGELIEEWRQN